MKRSRLSDEQISAIVKEQEAGMAAAEVGRRRGISGARQRPHISPPVSRWPAPINIGGVTPPGVQKASVPVAPIMRMVLWFGGGRLIACWWLQAATSDLSLARP